MLQFIIVLAICATSAIATNEYWHSAARVKREVDNHVIMRFKRDAESNDTNACLSSCWVKMNDILADKGTKLRVSEFDNPFFDKTPLFDDKATLPAMCEHYKATKMCADECTSESQMIVNVLEYLCVTHIDEFTKYHDCYEKNKFADNLCIVKCGTGENDIVGLAAKIDKGDGEKNFVTILNSMGQVCKFSACSYDCERPNYMTTCKTEKPVDLMQDLTALSVNGTLDNFSKVGLSSLLPIDCKILTGAAPKRPTGVFASSGSNDDLEREKLQLEIAVLTKKSTMLDAQMENLKLQKQVLEKQLA